MERYSVKEGDLFKNGTTSDLENILKQEVFKRIQGLDDNKVLNIAANEYINYLSEDLKIECPEVLFDDWAIDRRTVIVPKKYQPAYLRYSRCDDEITRTVYRLCIPFSGGNKDVLRYLPSTFSLGGSGRFCFNFDEIYIDILDVNGNGENVKREIQSHKDDLIKMLVFLKIDIERINKSICSYISEVFKVRKEKIMKEQDVLADLGIPIKSKTSSCKTYSVPTVAKRIQEPIISNLQPSEPITPTMEENIYQQILDGINSIGKSYERYPQTIENQNEETIREHLLTQLSTTFKSCSSTGESFNHKGKTDIMVKHGDDVLFIAECKIWKGQKKLNEAIDQLLSYLTWRDSKTALLIFNRDTGIQTVLQSIQDSIPTHPNYVKMLKGRDKGWFDYSFHLNDSNEEIKMAVMVFDFKNK